MSKTKRQIFCSQAYVSGATMATIDIIFVSICLDLGYNAVQ
jgi:hypothetical protein